MKPLPGRPLGGVAVPFKGFDRIRALDFSKLLPGPYASQMLAEMGCRVTRLELPHFPDFLREVPPKVGEVGAIYWMVNQGKRRLVFDFRKDRKRLEELVRDADILLETFRPGLMDRLGLGWEDVRRLNPRLIYCSISGYDPSGAWARKAGHDLNFQAMSGALGLTMPATPPAAYADHAGSMAAVAGIMAALVERETTSRGRWLRISMTDAIHSWLTIPLGELEATGEDPGPRRRWWNGGHAFYNLYQTADGGYLAVAAVEKMFALSLLELLGLSALKELADDPIAHCEELSRELSRVFMTATRQEWEGRLEGKDVCVTPVLSPAEAVSWRARSRKAGPGKDRARKRPSRRSAREKPKG